MTSLSGRWQCSGSVCSSRSEAKASPRSRYATWSEPRPTQTDGTTPCRERWSSSSRCMERSEEEEEERKGEEGGVSKRKETTSFHPNSFLNNWWNLKVRPVYRTVRMSGLLLPCSLLTEGISTWRDLTGSVQKSRSESVHILPHSLFSAHTQRIVSKVLRQRACPVSSATTQSNIWCLPSQCPEHLKKKGQDESQNCWEKNNEFISDKKGFKKIWGAANS